LHPDRSSLCLLLLAIACSAPEPRATGRASCEPEPAGGQLFPTGSPWTELIESAALDPESDDIIEHLATWHDSSGRFRIDFSMHVLEVDAGAERRAFTPTAEFYEPDCDPAPIPLPSGGAVEAEAGYECTNGGDCHLLVVDRAQCRLYEMWRADLTSAGFFGGCQAVWDLSRVYPEAGRGEYCTSADAAGLPIAPLVFDADEVAAGRIDHALRFTLPNNLIRQRTYLRPATHSSSAASGGVDAPPFGARLRLKADVDISALAPAARVVAEALKRHGMFLADGGKATFVAGSDRFSRAKWAEVDLQEHHLMSLAWTDFELVAGGARIDSKAGDCSRVPIQH
jgi:hypothetical protein